MKISFFIGSLRRSGAERVISILANHYAEKNWDVDIVLLLDTTVEYDLNPRINIVNLSRTNGSYFRRMPGWLTEIRKYIRQSKPNRVVSFVGRINMLVLTATLGMRIPVIVSERNDPKHDGRGKAIQIYCNLIYRKADAVVYQTKYEQSCFSKSLKNGYVIPNPVNILVKPSDIERPEIVTAGRLMPQKNQGCLIEAFSKVHIQHPELKLKIYGDGALKSKLQALIENLELQESVELCGNVSDLHEKISGAMMFVLTSEFEGLSNALIEAMMLGLPCISTDYPGADELIENHKTGLIVQRGNIEGLAATMKMLVEDAEMRKALAGAGRKNSVQYEKKNVLKLWEQVIERE